MTTRLPVRELASANTPQPVIALLGIAPFTAVITNGGGGQTRFGPLAVNRWRRDGTLDDYGQWCYVKDLETQRTWSAAYQPVCAEASSYLVRFESDRAVFERSDGEIDTRMEIALSSKGAAEFRRVTVFNRSSKQHEIELTSYAEVVIAPFLADLFHPAFGNLFVQTEWLAQSSAILAMRRPRSAENVPVWCGHALSVKDGAGGRTSCETDRANFVGRGRSTRNPVAMDKVGALSGRAGAVLDPIFSIRTRLSVPARGSAEATFTTYMAADREQALELAELYNDARSVASAFDRACAEASKEPEELQVTASDAALYQDLAGHLLFPSSPCEPSPLENSANTLGRTELKALGISGSMPVVLAIVRSAAGLPGIEELLKVHTYWQAKGIACDLIILDRHSGTGLQNVLDRMGAITPVSSDLTDTVEPQGKVVILHSDSLAPEQLDLLNSVARFKVECDGTGIDDLVKSLDAANRSEVENRRDFEAKSTIAVEPQLEGFANTKSDPKLLFFNGMGGFNDRSEYEIRLTGDDLPPAPWINVVANESGGFIASETGAGSTWVISSSSFRLSPWHNDPVCDRPGECIYLRDEETGEIWTPTPEPIRERTAYTVKHGAGYSTFDHVHDGIATLLRMGVPTNDPVKLQVLTLSNRGSRPRRLGMVSYVEWVLGNQREHTQHHVRTSLDARTEVMLARNSFEREFAGMSAFSAISEPLTGYTASRGGFLGRNGSLSRPHGLVHNCLDGKTGSSPDPCAALQTEIHLAPGETKSLAIVLGATQGHEEALAMVERYRSPALASAAIDAAASAWRARLGTITVETPEPAFDLILNQWAFYQALSCRTWGRTALYQSSGAYGFRDQLQDVMAFTYADPALTRDQIIRAASRQFEEGDVQHWWHPHNGVGVRTRFADDLVWLPFVVDHYLRVTHDSSVLDEQVPYLRMRTLFPDEDELYAVPEISDVTDSVFNHCVHALRHACTEGEHGLPLMRSGDWNDGMNRVGVEGKGESVWLAWFLITTLKGFADHAEARGDDQTADQLRIQAETYRAATETSAWDGEWYRRAYYDDGAPLGSHVNEECQIDSIAQSWSVISGAGNAERSKIAMQSLYTRLVRDDARLLMLLTPPFDHGTHDPGYIQGYLPGVRENGSQYTHAALWAVLATALQGDGNRAMELYQMINPITHALTPKDVSIYKVEPYVVAADVYTAEGHLGRGGWTWYTGSASWLYRVGLEAILGFTKRGEELEINPCIPAEWKEFSIAYRHGESVYTILVRNPSGVQKGVDSVYLDGAKVRRVISLVGDGMPHEVIVNMG